MSKVDIKKFSPKQIETPTIMSVIGKKGSGKSTLVRDICFNLKDRFHNVVAMTRNQRDLEEYKEFIPDCFLFQDWDATYFEKILMGLQQHSEKKRQTLLIIDDSILANYSGDSRKLLADPSFRHIIFNNRHLNLTVLFTMQYCMDLPPYLRSLIDYCFSYKENCLANRKRLRDYFFGMFESMNDFSKCLSETTKDYECLVVDGRKSTFDVENNLFFYKAEINIPPFQIGNAEPHTNEDNGTIATVPAFPGDEMDVYCSTWLMYFASYIPTIEIKWNT